MYVFQRELCTCMFTRSRANISMRVSLGARVSLEAAIVSGGERRSVEDGNKVKLFIALEWEQEACATLRPLAIYFEVGVWECWTRLNIPALTKQRKINTGDWGYNNTQQPLLPSNSLLLEMPSGPHIKTRK